MPLKDPEARRAYGRRYYHEHKDDPELSVKRRAQIAAWHDANRQLTRERSAAWAIANPERTLEHGRAWRHKKWATDMEWREEKKRKERERRAMLQRKAIAHYGGQCFCCGETEPLFLTLDHINGGGNKERKETSYMRTGELARRLGYPNTFRVACRNCNHGVYANGGVCPHQAGMLIAQGGG